MSTWKIDPSHSEVKFKTKHLVISTVTGHFNQYEGNITTDKGDFSDAKATFEASVDSIDTKSTQRDGHLKSADFFDAASFPKLSFTSTSFSKKSENEFEMVGDLTIRGISKEVKLNVVFNGTVKGFGGSDVAAFEVTGSINRQDFNLKWSALTEAGGVVLADEVKIEVLIEAIKAA